MQCQIDGLSELPAKARGALFGLTVGVKDLFDTADLPTAYGSDVYQDHCPMADAAAVAGLCAEGAVIIGKTVSAAFRTLNNSSLGTQDDCHGVRLSVAVPTP